MKVALVLLLTAVASACADASSTAFFRAAEYSADQRGTVLLVMKGGKTIVEDYRGGASRSAVAKIYSGTKGFWSLAALAAQEDGLLDLDEKACETLTEWVGDAKKSRITLRELLNFSAGLNEAYSLHNDGWSDRTAFALKQPVLGTPGKTFIYGPTGLQCFHEVLRRKLAPRRETPTRYLERRVLRPLGLGPQRYLGDKAGAPLLATGFMMSPAQWMKMGRALLADGAPVLRGSLNEALRGSAANPMFGLGFWNNKLAGSGAREIDPEEMLHRKWHQQDWREGCLCRTAPRDLVASIGSGGQRLYAIPSLDLVVVRLGGLTKFSDAAFLRALLSE